MSGELILSQATKNLKIIYSLARLGACSKSKVTPLFSGKIGFIINIFLAKLNWTITEYSLLEQSPYILTTNVVCYIYYFHQKKLKEKPTIYKTCNFSDSGQAFVLLLLTRKPGLCIFMLIYFYHELFLCKISMFELDYVRIMQIVGYMNCWTL